MQKKSDIIEKTLLGNRLKQARESANFTAAEIASQLNLTKSVIIYLESNNYSSSHRDVFYRGYLRSYAKLLGLPAEELIDDYCSIVGSNEMVVKSHLSINNSVSLVENRFSNKIIKFISAHIKLITFISLFLLIVMTGIWWHNKFYYAADDNVYLTKELDFATYVFDDG